MTAATSRRTVAWRWDRRHWPLLALATVALVAGGLVVAGGRRGSRPVQRPSPSTARGATTPASGTDTPTSEVAAQVGAPAAPFSIPNLRYTDADLSVQQHAGVPIVLTFWASWCVPCRPHMRELADAARSLDGKVVFLSVNIRDDRDEALELLRSSGADYDSGYDPYGRVAAVYGVKGLPTTVFISPEGEQLARREGAMTRDELAAAVRRQFALTG